MKAITRNYVQSKWRNFALKAPEKSLQTPRYLLRVLNANAAEYPIERPGKLGLLPVFWKDLVLLPLETICFAINFRLALSIGFDMSPMCCAGGFYCLSGRSLVCVLLRPHSMRGVLARTATSRYCLVEACAMERFKGAWPKNHPALQAPTPKLAASLNGKFRDFILGCVLYNKFKLVWLWI